MKIDKKSMLLVVAVLVCFVQAGFAGVMFFARGTVERELNSDKSNLQLLENRSAKIEAELPPPSKPVPESRPKLLAGPDIVGSLQVIQRLGDDAGVTFERQQAEPQSEIGRQRFTVEGRGRPDQVCAFVAGVEQCERLLVVENGRLMPADDFELKFEIVLVTFYRSELK